MNSRCMIDISNHLQEKARLTGHTHAFISRWSVEESKSCTTDSINCRCSCVTFKICVKYHSGYDKEKFASVTKD